MNHMAGVQPCHQGELKWEGNCIGKGGGGEEREREIYREKSEKWTEMEKRAKAGRACLLKGSLQLHTEPGVTHCVRFPRGRDRFARIIAIISFHLPKFFTALI